MSKKKHNERLDMIDKIIANETAEDAARVLSLLVQRGMPEAERDDMNAYIRAHGYVVKLEEFPRVQLPGVYDRATVGRDLKTASPERYAYLVKLRTKYGFKTLRFAADGRVHSESE